MIQSVLNHLPSPSRVHCAALKIMTGLGAFSPLSVVLHPDANKICDWSMSQKKCRNTCKTWGNLWIKSTGKLKLRWKARELPREAMLTRSTPLWNLTKETTPWLLLLNLNISPNFTPDRMDLIKSVTLSQIGCFVVKPSNSWSARLRKQCMPLASILLCNVTIRLQEQI